MARQCIDGKHLNYSDSAHISKDELSYYIPEYGTSAANSYCDTCANNIKNGGSGICNCVLADGVVTGKFAHKSI